MIVATLDERLTAAVTKRNTLDADFRRVEGRLEAARTTLAEAEAACRAKGVEPDQIDATITKLEERFEALVVQLEKDIGAAELTLAPYAKER